MAEQDARPKSGHVKIERHPDIDPDDSIAMREIQELSYKLPELRKKVPPHFHETHVNIEKIYTCCYSVDYLCCNLNESFVATYLFVIGLAIPTSLIAVGLMKIGECPDQTALPHWMYHFGILILLSMIVKFVWQKFGDKSLRKTNAKILVSLRVIFGVILVMKYFYGLYLMLWVFFMKDPACDLFLQLFALFMLILTGLIATLGCCFVCCGVGLKNVEKTDFFQNAVLHTGIQESDFLLPKQVIGNLLQ